MFKIIRNIIINAQLAFPGIFIILIISISCRKETTSGFPNIHIQHPSENQHFNVSDTIFIKANIKDEVSIQSIKTSLVNKNFQPAHKAIYSYPGNSKYTLELFYPLDNLHLESGEYYIQIRVANGTNAKNKYQRIYIKGIPVKFEKLLVVTKKNQNQMIISEIDNHEINLVTEISGDFTSSEISSKNRQLYIAGSTSLNLLAFNIDEKQIDWKLDKTTYIPMHSNDCLYFDEFLYSSFANIYCRGFDNSGFQVFIAVFEESVIPTKIYRHENYIITDIQSKTGGLSYVMTNYLVSGAAKQKLFSNYKVVEFFSYDEDNVVIIANRQSKGYIKLYDVHQHIQTEIKEIQQPIISAVQITANTLLIGTTDEILLYDFEYNSLSVIKSNIKAYRLKYDDINDMLYIVGSYDLRNYKFPEMELLKTQTFSDSLLNVHLLFNK